jgi:hypothetical protein
MILVRNNGFEEEVLGFRFIKPNDHLVCMNCLTPKELNDLENAENIRGSDFFSSSGLEAISVTEEDLSNMGHWASEMICDRCNKLIGGGVEIDLEPPSNPKSEKILPRRVIR